MACRDMRRCEKARADILEQAMLPDIECRELDLSSFKSIRNFVQRIKDGMDVCSLFISLYFVFP